MKILAIVASVVAVACGAAIPSLASAQATRTWISGVGDDANPCSRTAPCKTYAGAISKTAAGGEINTLDPGGFGAVTITKSITLGTDPSMGGILGALSNGITINAAATDVVNIRGMVVSSPISGASTGLNGIRILNAGTVNIENSYIYGNRSSAPNGAGVALINSTGTTRLNIIDTVISENGDTTTGGGVVIKPTGSGGAVVTLNNVRLVDNTRGLVADATGTTGSILGAVSESMIANNTRTGIVVIAGAAPVALTVTATTSSNNLTGMYVEGAGGILRIDRNFVTGSTTGLQTASSGQIVSYGTNVIDGNTTNGAPTSTAPLR